MRHKQQWLAYAGSLATASGAKLSADRQKLSDRLEQLKGEIPEVSHHTKTAQAASGQPPAPDNAPKAAASLDSTVAGTNTGGNGAKSANSGSTAPGKQGPPVPAAPPT